MRFLEFHSRHYLIATGHVCLIVIVNLLTVLYTCTHHIGHIYDRDAFAEIVCDGRVPEGVGVQGEMAPQRYSDRLKPQI